MTSDQQQQLVTSGPWFHLQHARWQMDHGPIRDEIDRWIHAMFGQNEVPGVSPMPPDRQHGLKSIDPSADNPPIGSSNRGVQDEGVQGCVCGDDCDGCHCSCPECGGGCC